MSKTQTTKSYTERLSNQISEYIRDNDNNYAIGLEGEWGSGKTRYIETELKDYIKSHNKFSLIRVSLFGLTRPEELYERLALAIVKLDSKKSSVRVGLI